jgi:hypothetical protein
VEVAERFAEGLATTEELKAARTLAGRAYRRLSVAKLAPLHREPPGQVDASDRTYKIAAAAAALVTKLAFPDVVDVAHAACSAVAVRQQDARARGPEQDGQADLLRDLLGPLPFRPVSLGEALLAWHDGTVVRLAEAAYEYRNVPQGTLDNGRLAVLADALEEAGLENQEVLQHLREQGREHYRGCYVLDLLLNKD